MCRKCFLTFFFFTATSSLYSDLHCQERYRLVFWNVENLFDIWDDSTRNDDAFTPAGDNHWTLRRYNTKLTHIAKTLVALGKSDSGGFSMPSVVGMGEVENDKVLRDLCQGTPLRRFGYGFVHFDSPDRRGIDVALLYRKSHFTPFFSQAVNVSDSAEQYFTRDLLLVGGTTREGDTLFCMVCHLPSKLGGTTADLRRMAVANRMRGIMDSLVARYPSAAIVVMGDFNGAPDEEELRCIVSSQGASQYLNLMALVEPGKGSYKFQDHWSCLDQIVVSRAMAERDSRCPLKIVQRVGEIFDADFLLLDDDKFLGKKVFRTYLGMKYLGGYSDHLPVYIDLQRERK